MAAVTSEMISHYQRDGFVHVPGILDREEALHFRAAALAAADRLVELSHGPIFDQYVNVWQHDGAMRELTLHPAIAAAARALACVDLRLWHDQILIKQPGTSRATEFHQDQPYWPHENSTNPISCWIALGDVRAEDGCMTFLPGSQTRTDLPPQNLGDSRSLLDICPEFEWLPRVTVPLRAGDCTFHHGRCAHMATPNVGTAPRVAHVVIFMDATTQFSGVGHVVTDPLGLTQGERIEGPLFPLTSSV